MIIIDNKFETRCLSSLAKVFPDGEIVDQPFCKASALLNEVYSFQIAYKGNEHHLQSLKVRIESDLKKNINVRSVGLVPSDFPMYEDHDEHILRSAPGLYPDPLYPLELKKLPDTPDQWHAIWITVNLNEFKFTVFP